MNDAIADTALDYLSPCARGFWQWSDDAQVICWRGDGRTIAFRSEIEAVVGALAGQGLPPFGSILLFMASCLPNWRREAATGPRWAQLLADIDLPDWNN